MSPVLFTQQIVHIRMTDWIQFPSPLPRPDKGLKPGGCGWRELDAEEAGGQHFPCLALVGVVLGPLPHLNLGSEGKATLGHVSAGVPERWPTWDISDPLLLSWRSFVGVEMVVGFVWIWEAEESLWLTAWWVFWGLRASWEKIIIDSRMRTR